MDERNITVVSTEPEAEDRAAALASLLGATQTDIHSARDDPQTPNSDPDLIQTQAYQFRLLVDRHTTRLEWRDPSPGTLSLSFTEGRNRYRMQAGGRRRDTLARAIGLGKNATRRDTTSHSILDATAGLCRDTWAMAAYGCPVIAFERSAWLNWMQRDALAQALANPDTHACAARLTLVRSDVTHWLKNWSTHNRSGDLQPRKVSAIYLDPMYPQRKKSAAVKKDMQVLHQLIGADTDSEKLLTAALDAARHGLIERVVVKRPASGDSLHNPWQVKPTHTHKSKNTRYDVYMGQSLKF